MARKLYKKLPTELIGATFGFTGTLPGVGKSYFRRWLRRELVNQKYRVINTGFTHKATDDDGNTLSSKTKKNKIYSQTDGIFLIDEAFMMGKNQLANLKKQYPKCCFMLFGDPLQFDPPDSKEKPLDNDDFNYVWEFDTPHRSTDYRLIKFIENVKNGNVDEVWKVMENKQVPEVSITDLNISYNRKKHEVINNKLTEDRIGCNYVSSRVFTYEDSGYDAKYESRHSWNEVMNAEIWKMTDKSGKVYTLKSLSRNKELKVVDGSIEWQHFKKIAIINAHQIQGDTFSENTKTVIWLDNEYNLQKLLYVAASRLKTFEQLNFFLIAPKPKKDWQPLVSNIKPDWKGDNDKLIEEIKSDTFSGNNSLYNICNCFSKKVSLFGLGIKQNQSFYTDKVGITGYIAKNKPLLQRERVKVDKELLKLYTTTLPSKNGLFVSKNCEISHSNEDVNSYHNFVFEFDELTIEEQQNLIRKHRKLIYRTIFSGNKSYHVWLRVKNAPDNADDYRKMARHLNYVLFDGKACQSCISPAGLMRAPTETQPIYTNKRNIIIVDMPKEEEKQCEIIETQDNAVQYYFEMAKDDHDGSDGGRGQLILRKAKSQKIKRGWSNEQCKELIRLLCIEWKCPEKINHLQSYFN